MIKRKLAFILAVALILCIVTSAMAYTTMYVYTANGKSLNLRDAPSYSGGIMTTIPNGTAVRVNDSYNPTWYSVTYGRYTGYAMSCYLVSSLISYSPEGYSFGSLPMPTADPEPKTNIDINIDIGSGAESGLDSETESESDSDADTESALDSETELEAYDASDSEDVSALRAGILNEMFSGFKTIYYQAMVRPDNTAGYANLYWAPSLDSGIHGQYYANEVLIVMSQNSLWCQVLDQNNSVMGYMLRQFLTAFYYGDS